MKTLASLLVIALLLAISATAQTGSSSFAGTVVDSTNRVVPGASVTLVNEGSGEQRTAITNDTGEFVFPAISPGTYTVKITASGFRAFEGKGNVVVSSTRFTIGTVQLEVGAVSESVQVTAQGAQVQTDSSDKSELVDQKELQQISIRGRDPISFLGLLPGTVQGQNPNFLGASYGSTIPNFQGLTTNTNVMMADGVNGGYSQGGGIYAATVNMDGIAEVHVLMNNYNAEYGRSGGTIINLITKSGGREYHGSGWLYKQHEQFNANNFFNNASGIGKPLNRTQTIGGDIGGPANFVPKMRDKLFFFVLFEDMRLKTPQPLERWTMPTALERTGDFSKSFNGSNLISVKDPLTGQAFPGNVIPASRVNPYGLAEMNILPLPNYAGSGFNYLYQEPFLNQPRQSQTVRVDYRPTIKDVISVTYKGWGADMSGIHVAAAASKWGLAYMTYAFAAIQGTMSWTRIINSHMVNELFVGGMHDVEQSPPVGPDCTTNGCGQYNPLKRQYRGALQQLGQFNNTWNPYNYVPLSSYGGIPTSFSAAAISFDGREPLSGYDTNGTFKDDLTYTYGPHTFKVGFFFEHSRFGQTATSNFSGNVDFGQNSLDPLNTGYAFSNAYIGHFNQYTEDLGRGQDNTRHRIQAWYAQDTWKLTHNLTLDIGMRIYRDPWPLQSDGVASIFATSRFDPSWGGNPPVLYAPAFNASNQRVAVNPVTGVFYPQSYIGNIAPGTGNTCLNLSDTNPCHLNGIVVQNDPSYEKSLGFRDPVGPQFDPRIGIAWDPFGNGKTAIRAGIGEFHEAGTSVSGNYDRGPAFVYTRLVLNGTLDPTLFQTTPLTSPISVTGVEKHAKIPAVWQYTLGIQREVFRGTVASVTYVGNTQHYVNQNYNYNYQPFGIQFLPQYADPTNTSVPLPQQFLVPNKGYLNLNVAHPAARTRYDALQTKVQRRFTAGLEVDANFTWAKSFQYNSWSQLFPVSNFWGLANIDQTFVANFAYIYNFPKFSRWVGATRFTRGAVDNWQLSGSVAFGSGFPQNITLGTTDNFNFTGGGDVSAQVVLTCNPQLGFGDRSFSSFLNTSCVGRPSGRGQLGSILNGVEFRGPGFNNIDMTLFKNFPMGKDGHRNLQFRWEVFNVPNHAEAMTVNTSPRFNPAGQQTLAAFGTVTATWPERRMQLSLRFNF